MIQIRPVSDLRNKFPDIEKAANDLLDAVEKAIMERLPIKYKVKKSINRRGEK